MLKRLGIVAFVGLAFGIAAARADVIHRYPFETRNPVFIKGTSDAAFRELAHDISDANARNGQFSEHVQVLSENGSYIYYYYPTPRAPLVDELSASISVKGNRPGVQLLARLVLPKEKNPNQLDEPLTVLLRGEPYQTASRWQRLELRRPKQLARQQQQIMRQQLGRDVDFTDAYIDRLMINVYAGPGMTELWVDDLEIGPVIEERTPIRATSQPKAGSPSGVKLLAPGGAADMANRALVVEMDGGRLKVNRKRFFFRGIRHSDTPLRVLRDAGCNTVWLDHAASPALLDEAATLGFLIVPSIPVNAEDTKFTSAEHLRQEITRFLDRDQVLFWDLGGGLTEEQAGLVTQTARLVRSIDPQRPIGGDAWDGFGPYSNKLDLLGTHRWPLMTGLELNAYRQWLNQRRLLCNTDVCTWTWVQTHLPDWYTTLVHGKRGADGFDEAVGPLPEQIRLLTYLSLASGCRGLGYWSDRFLADSHQGRDRLLSLALLNQELRMLEPLLVTAEPPAGDESSWIATSSPDVKAAVLRTDRGILVLPIWVGPGSQFVPGQAAASNLTLTVPQVPLGTQVWQITPGHVRCLTPTRETGGTRVTVPEFGLTTVLLFTSDIGQKGIVAHLQDLEQQSGPLCAQWAIQLGEEEISKVIKIHDQLGQMGHTITGADKLLENAKSRLKVAARHWESRDYREAYAEAERALRPLRILMRGEWELATKEIKGLAVASPFAVSYFTLPRHWKFMDAIRQAAIGPNVLPHGGFESAPERGQEAWLSQESTLDEVTMTARRVTTDVKEGKQCLMLEIVPKSTANGQIEALERSFLAINSPTVHLPAGTLVRITGWVKIAKPITASVDGALFYDSAGGEPLALRLTQPLEWQLVTLYRQVPASGQIHVTLALTGIGAVYFDDVRIETLQPGSGGGIAPQGILTSRTK